MPLSPFSSLISSRAAALHIVAKLMSFHGISENNNNSIQTLCSIPMPIPISWCVCIVISCCVLRLCRCVCRGCVRIDDRRRHERANYLSQLNVPESKTIPTPSVIPLAANCIIVVRKTLCETARERPERAFHCNCDAELASVENRRSSNNSNGNNFDILFKRPERGGEIRRTKLDTRRAS